MNNSKKRQFVDLGQPGSFYGALILGVGLGGIHAEHPENLFLLVATVSSGVDTDGRELTAFAPAFDGEGR